MSISAFSLAVRSLLLAIFEKKTAVGKLCDSAFFILYLFLGLCLLLAFGPLSGIRLALLLSPFLIGELLFRLRRPYQRRPALLLLKTLFACSFLLLSFLLLSSSFYNSLSPDNPIGQAVKALNSSLSLLEK